MEFHCIDQLNWPRPLWTNQNSSPRNLHQGLRDSSLVWLRPWEEKNVCWELWQPGSGMVGRLVYFKRRIEERSKNTVREKRQAQIPETQLVSKAWVHPLPWVSLTYLIPLKYTPSFSFDSRALYYLQIRILHKRFSGKNNQQTRKKQIRPQEEKCK